MASSTPTTTATTLYTSLEQSYTASNPRSASLYSQALRSLPGGNTRSVLFYPPFPLSITHARGPHLFSADCHIYVDFLGEYTAGIYGHSDPVIIAAITDAVSRGLNFGAQHADEARLASLIKERFASIELVRFTNPGTEATLMALAAARAWTGKEGVMVFRGGYHGGAFYFKDGGAGSVVNAPFSWLVADCNDLASVRKLLSNPKNAGDMAAILVEPMVGSGGAILATREFLEGLRLIANESSAVLIFDEVMTSRFYGGGGAQSQLPVSSRPDLTTLGKYIGGDAG